MPLPFHLPAPNRALSAVAMAWFVAAGFGQLIFVTFIAAFYLPPLWGDPAAMNVKPHITSYVPGDVLGNLQFLLHVFVGGLVTLLGLLQLAPLLRRRWPALHRWNGRVFLVAALVASTSGFLLTWLRGSRLNMASAISTTLNGILIVVFVGLAWRSALARDFTAHRRHALRTYLLVNGVWFLRIAIMPASLAAAPLGIALGYDGPVFLGVSYLSWIAPLAILQGYFSAERGNHAGFTYAVAALLGLLALFTLTGSFAAAAFMWWPYL